MTSDQRDTDTVSPTTPAQPSSALWAAALTGLLGLGGVACSDGKSPVVPDPTPDAAVDAKPIDAPPDAFETPSKVISETEGNRTFADIKAECDTRHGYVQITAACSGSNSCAGFSYGDWDPGVTTEHSCAAVNGCNGISCVVLPPDTGKTALQVLSGEGVTFDTYGPQTCMNCHADWSGAQPDPTKFHVWVLPGSGRTAANWLDNPAEAQARTIAFGKHGLLADGTAYTSMQGYWKFYSRAEIERTVQYIRTTAASNIAIKNIKISDPPPAFQAGPGFVGGHRRRHAP
ncbi:MAG: hypothetical protein IPQ07_08250 [Myxococcales bacterium]|nr:hypothetical protein [Myxococcales bacterium]